MPRTEHDMKSEMARLDALITEKVKATAELQKCRDAIHDELRRHTDEQKQTAYVAEKLAELADDLRSGRAHLRSVERRLDGRCAATAEYQIGHAGYWLEKRTECTLKIIS
jgi:chromosome segregation ATPase